MAIPMRGCRFEGFSITAIRSYAGTYAFVGGSGASGYRELPDEFLYKELGLEQIATGRIRYVMP